MFIQILCRSKAKTFPLCLSFNIINPWGFIRTLITGWSHITDKSCIYLWTNVRNSDNYTKVNAWQPTDTPQSVKNHKKPTQSRYDTQYKHPRTNHFPHSHLKKKLLVFILCERGKNFCQSLACMPDKTSVVKMDQALWRWNNSSQCLHWAHIRSLQKRASHLQVCEPLMVSKPTRQIQSNAVL